MSEPLTVKELLKVGERVLEDSTHIFEDHDKPAETRELLAMCLQIDKDDLDLDLEPPADVRQRYLSLIARRGAGEPFPFLTGHILFWDLDLKVWPGAFVPRPSSELTVEWAIGHLEKKTAPVIVDVCTGAGPIIIALAHEFPEAECWGLDISEEGLQQGRANSERLSLTNTMFGMSDLYEALPARLRGKVDLITGHVPYVHPDELEDLPSEVKDYEPEYMLSDASDDGLGLMRRAVSESVSWLAPEGWLLLEMAEDLSYEVEQMLKKAGFVETGVVSDDDGLSVVVEGRYPG